MHHRLLDLLACPVDNHFPLELEVATLGVNQATQTFPVACQNHCSFTSGPASTDPGTCADCYSVVVTRGRLHCPACGQSYPIVDGIADLLPVDDRPAPELQDQRREMATRDAQVHRYDRLKLLRLLSLVEKPLALRLLGRFADDNVLELGCGTGRLTVAVARQASNLLAVDFSLESLRRCRHKLEGRGHVHYVRADVSRLPFREAVFSAVLSCQVFEHLPAASLRRRAVAEAARVLTPGGGLVISVYRHFWFSRLFGPKEGYHPGGIYYHRFTPTEFKSLLDSGFEVDVHYPNVGNYVQLAGCRKRLP